MIESALQAELDRLPEATRTSTLATAALELARRLDREPGDDTAVKLSRELRQTVKALHDGIDVGTDEIETFLDRIAAPQLGNAQN